MVINWVNNRLKSICVSGKLSPRWVSSKKRPQLKAIYLIINYPLFCPSFSRLACERSRQARHGADWNHFSPTLLYHWHCFGSYIPKTKESTTNISQNQIIGVSKTSIKNILYFTLVGGNLVQNMGGNVTGWSHVTTGTKFFTQSTVGLLHLSMLCVFLKSNGHRKA